MPQTKELDEILSFDEIYQVAVSASKCDISKFKITGGEPLIRVGIVDFIKKLGKLENIEDITMTTNGFYLPRFVKDLKEAGLSSINISLDSLDREKFKNITGTDALMQVMDGIEAAVEACLNVKINTVIQKNINEDELFDIIDLARNKPLDIRFIEIMPIGYGKTSKGVSNDEILEKIKSRYNVEKEDKKHGNGPAEYIRISEFEGAVGFIGAIHNKFCENCNRIRLTSTGQLKSCLCYASSIDLKYILKNNLLTIEEKQLKLEECIRECILKKPHSHAFEDISKVSELKDMAEIGG